MGGTLSSKVEPYSPELVVAGQQAAVARLRRIAERTVVPPCTPLLICGRPGTGKSHLLASLVKSTGDRRRVFWDSVELRSLLRVCTLQLVAAQVDFRAELDPARARVVLEEAGLLASVSPEPRPDEIPPLHRHISGVFRQVDSGKDRKARFKQMLTEAETDDEKRLALEIVLGERLRELKGDRANVEVRLRFERALGLLRNGNLGEALRHIG